MSTDDQEDGDGDSILNKYDKEDENDDIPDFLEQKELSKKQRNHRKFQKIKEKFERIQQKLERNKRNSEHIQRKFENVQREFQRLITETFS